MEATSRAKIWKIVMLLCRLGLGGVFIAAAYSKMEPLAGMPWSVASVKASLSMFAMGVDSYQMLPAWAVSPLAHFLPFFEIVLGIWLISGIGLRISSLLSTLSLCAFIYAMFSVWHRGLTVTCGCFGQGGPPIGPRDMMRDGLLFLPPSVVLMVGSFMAKKNSASAMPSEAVRPAPPVPAS